jgi:hypothetical protein
MFEQLSSLFGNQMLVIPIVGCILLLLTELGFRRGRTRQQQNNAAIKDQLSSIQGAVLGILGLLLGFTFAMAVARFESRRDVVLQEANSIGTTYLRAELLPPEQARALQKSLLEYIAARLEFYDAGKNAEKILAAEQKSKTLHAALWSEGKKAAAAAPTAVTATFINSLNETIDLDAVRLHALRSHVPGSVWLILIVAAGVGCFTTGYGAGFSGFRNAFSNFILPALITFLITLIADLDRPRQGLIGVDQRPLRELHDSLKSDSASGS